MAVGNDYLLYLNDTTRLLRPGITSATIKSYLSTSLSYQVHGFGWGEYDLTDWATPATVTLPTIFRGVPGATRLLGDVTVSMFQISAPVVFYGITFKDWDFVCDFVNTSGSKLPWVRFIDCEFIDCIRPIYCADTVSAAETIGAERVDIVRCRFTAANLTLDDPGLGVRDTDGEPCIEWQAPADSFNVEGCHAYDIKKSFCRFGFTGEQAEAPNWKKFSARGNAIDKVRSGQNGSTNNASGIHFFGVDAICENNQISDVQCGDGDEQTGIFVFCETALIANNRLNDCGGHDAAISIKGDSRVDTTTNPPGYRIQIVNNSITFTDAHTVAQPNVSRGIWCQQEDVLIAGNIVDRATGSALHVIGGGNSHKNIIRDNIFTNGRINDTSDGVVHLNAGDDLLFEANIVECTAQGTTAGRCVRVQPNADGARKNWTFRGNTIKNSGGGTASRGFMVVASSDIAPLVFRNNDIRGVQQGIRFDTGTISDTIIEGNRFASDVTTPISMNVVPTRYRIGVNPGRVAAGITFAADDPSPSVWSSDGGIYLTSAYTILTAIGKFDGAVNNDNGDTIEDGTVIRIVLPATNIFRIQHNASIYNASGADYIDATEVNFVRSYIKTGGATPIWRELT